MSASVTGDFAVMEWIDGVEDEVKNTERAIAQILFTYQTDEGLGEIPVKSGAFRASWNVSRGEPDTTHEDPNVQQERVFGNPPFDLEDGDGPIYITNAIPYAVRLNNQANPPHVNRPVRPGFFERNFQSALNVIESGNLQVLVD